MSKLRGWSGAIGIYGVEVTDAAKQSVTYKTAPQKRTQQPKTSVVLPLKKSHVNQLPCELNSYQTSPICSSILPNQIGYTKTCESLLTFIWSICHLYSKEVFHICLPLPHLNYKSLFSGAQPSSMSTFILSLRTPRKKLMLLALHLF